MLPVLKTKTVKINGLGELVIREMSGKCYIEQRDARADGKDAVVIAAIVAQRCVPDWCEHEPAEILDQVSTGVLIDILHEVVKLSNMEIEDAGKSEAGQDDSSSSSSQLRSA